MTAPASSQLGETTDPTKLVPGKVADVVANATLLGDEKTTISDIYDQFDALSVPGWSGGLGQPAFQANYDDERTKWTTYIDLLDSAEKTLTTYADALGKAQSRAQDAIDRWAEGDQATSDAVTAYDAAVAAYNDYVCRPAPVPASPFGPVVPTVPSMGPAEPGPFVDPGEKLRDEAQEILDQARADLDKAGSTAVVELGGLDGGKSEGDIDVWGASGDAHGPKFSWDLWSDTFGKDPSDGKDGKYDDEHDSPFTISLGSAEGEVHVWKADGSYEDYLGEVEVNADGSVTLLGLDGSAEATVDSEGVRINADGTVTIVGGEGTVHGEYGPLEGALSGDFLAGATGEGHLTVNGTGAHAGGELFAGGQVSATAEGDVGGVGGSVNAEGWAGVGIAGDVDLGFDDGTLTIGGSGGAAFGLGGHLGGEINLDFPEMWESGGEILDGIGGLFD